MNSALHLILFTPYIIHITSYISRVLSDFLLATVAFTKSENAISLLIAVSDNFMNKPLVALYSPARFNRGHSAPGPTGGTASKLPFFDGRFRMGCSVPGSTGEMFLRCHILMAACREPNRRIVIYTQLIGTAMMAASLGLFDDYAMLLLRDLALIRPWSALLLVFASGLFYPPTLAG
jgi:hypothetical protein